MQKIIIAILIILSTLNAQNYVVPLWDETMPNFQQSDEVDSFITDAEVEHYRTVVKPEIFIYQPANINNTGQAVLIIPGGGYGVICHNWEGTDIAKWLNSHGITGIVLKYRLPHSKCNIVSHKSPLLDASRAMKIIRANAEEWKIDKNNIGVMGFSAGGHLASTLGTHYNRDGCNLKDELSKISSRPDFMVLIYPVITMDKNFTHMGSRNNLLGKKQTKKLINYYSNEKQVDANTPPTFLVHSSDDKVVPVQNSIDFYSALQEYGIKSELHVYQYGGHGFALANKKGYLKSWREICINWMINVNKGDKNEQ